MKKIIITSQQDLIIMKTLPLKTFQDITIMIMAATVTINPIITIPDIILMVIIIGDINYNINNS